MSTQEHHRGEFVGRTTDVDHRHEARLRAARARAPFAARAARPCRAHAPSRPAPQDSAYGGLSSGEKSILTRRSHGEAIALPKGVLENAEKIEGAKKYVKDHNLDSKKVNQKTS